MNITKTESGVSWVYGGQPCGHGGEKVALVKQLAQFEAIAVLDSESLFVYNYCGSIRFIVRSEGPMAFAVKDVFDNGHILCYYPNLPGRLYVCVLDWNTGTMQMKVKYE